MVAGGSLAMPEGVFYLQTAELHAASAARAAGQARPDLAILATGRRDLREARMRLQPPAAVPPSTRWKFGPIDISFAVADGHLAVLLETGALARARPRRGCHLRW